MRAPKVCAHEGAERGGTPARGTRPSPPDAASGGAESPDQNIAPRLGAIRIAEVQWILIRSPTSQHFV